MKYYNNTVIRYLINLIFYLYYLAISTSIRPTLYNFLYLPLAFLVLNVL
jgi:hypothetical protein